LAKRVRELESLPYGLSQLPPVVKVRGWYETSFRDILSHPEPTNEAEEESFTRLLQVIYDRHADVVPTLAQGVLQMKKALGASGTDVVNQCPFLQDFLNRFHSSRVGIRLLISQHIALHQPVDGFIGTFATNLSPMSVIRDAVSDAARMCDRYYGWSPDVEIIGDENQVINFVPQHLHHIMFELMKNSMRAVIEFNGLKNYDAPAIQVVLTNDEERYAIKVSDQGGGIPRKDMPRIFSYLYTTTNPTSTEELLNQIHGGGGATASGEGVDAAGGHPTNAVGPSGDAATPMSGFGYGLPISKVSLR
jgi:pyruvate dehydrogenase kinase 2/3/4